ncbi:MAG: UDP-N-acetylmuramate dehydrogenase [Gemmatimonadota bacterium]
MAADHGEKLGRLEAVVGRGRLQYGVPLAPFTTFRIGGPADALFRARTPEELAAAVTAAREMEIPYFILGRGANILVGDGGVRGLVVRNEARRVEFLEGQRVRASSGVEVYPDLIEATVARGLGGLHHFVGIPSSVGGALWQNLHFLSPPPARDRTVFIAEVLEGAELLMEDGTRRNVDAPFFAFGYDESILHHRELVVLSATFALHPEPEGELRRVWEANLEWRRARHPDLARLPSAGSIFKKIEGMGAGRLIDECGLKGTTRGGAAIFEGHANIIVNRGGATAADVRALIDLARETVLLRTGYALEPEISFVGEF